MLIFTQLALTVLNSEGVELQTEESIYRGRVVANIQKLYGTSTSL